MPDEAVVFKGYSGTKEGMRLNPAVFPNSYAFLNFNEWPDERMIADHATVNVARLDDLNAGAPIDVNDSTFKKLRTFGHLDGSNKLPQGFRR